MTNANLMPIPWDGKNIEVGNIYTFPKVITVASFPAKTTNSEKIKRKFQKAKLIGVNQDDKQLKFEAKKIKEQNGKIKIQPRHRYIFYLPIDFRLN